jgi:hypothetical protein
VLAIAAVLTIGGALTLVGSRQPRPDEIVDVPKIPEILRGQFVAQIGGVPATAGYPSPSADSTGSAAVASAPAVVEVAEQGLGVALGGSYFIALDNAVLVHGPGKSDDPVEIRAEDGTEAAWAGRIVRFAPASQWSPDPIHPHARPASVVIQAPLPCGEGRYIVQYDEDELTFTQPQDRCADRLAILTGRSWTRHTARLVQGKRYSSWSFTEPFQFLMPPHPPVDAMAQTSLAPGRLSYHHPWWFGDFFDDWELPIDGCEPGAGSLPDIPPNALGFETWLRSYGRSISETVEIEVDGRMAMRFDTMEPSCPGQAPSDFASRWYLIPTGDDTILFNFYGDTEAEYQVADQIVRSMTFD